MPIVDAVKACLAKYAEFNGRATRTEYWWFFLAVVLGSAVASLISLRVYALFSLVTLLPLIAVGGTGGCTIPIEVVGGSFCRWCHLVWLCLLSCWRRGASL